MSNFKSYILYGLSVGSLLFSALEGSFWDNQKLLLELDNGYRWDRIDESVEVVDFEFIQPYASAQHQYKDLNSYQLGGRFIWEKCNWRVKAQGHYGWIFDGHFLQDGFLRGKIHEGNTADGSGAIGYAFPVCECFRFCPLAGYGYDSQDLKIKHFRLFDTSSSSTDICRGRFEASWQGPWIGFDILYDTSFIFWNRCHYMTFNSGYEFHYGQARTKFHERLFDGEYSYHSKINNMMGQVFHFDTHYYLPCNWMIGLILEYTYWTNAHKHHDSFSSETDTGFTATQEQDTFKLRWQSISTIITVGKLF